MTAKEARELTNAAKFPNIDSEAQMADIMAKIDTAAKLGAEYVMFTDLTDENKKALIELGYSVSTTSRTNLTAIKW